MKGAALAALLAAGCQSSDPCFGVAGSCIGLTVEGEGVAFVDRLDYRLDGAGTDLRGGTPSSPGPRRALPLRTAVYPPDALAGDFTLAVAGLLDGATVGAGSVAVHLDPGGHALRSVTLRAPVDGGVPDGGLDLALDAAAPDLSPPDLARPFVDGMLPACPAGALLCDDFESGAFAAWDGPPTGQAAGDTLAIDAVRPFHGSRSLHGLSPGVDGGAGEGAAYLQKTWNPLPSSGVFAVRAYVYAANLQHDFTTLVHFTFSQGDLHVALANAPGLGDGYWNLFDDANHMGQTVAERVGAWECVEAVIDFAQRRYQLYVTDALAPDRAAPPIVDVSGALTLNPIQSLEVGLYHTPGVGAQEVFVDDVAVATARIGCE